MEITLANKTLLVTGSTQGLGLSIAELAVQSGVSGLIISGRDESRGMQVAQRLSCERTKAKYVGADLANPEAPASLFAEAEKEFGGVDLVVNSAGLTNRGGFLDGDLQTWDTLFNVNARASFFIMQQAIKGFLKREVPGAIVNILSMNAHCGAPDLSIYSATKGALATLTKNAANAFLADKIRVNGINMGWAPTDAEMKMQAETLGKGADWIAEASRGMPLGRMLIAEEVARSAIFLLSDFSIPMTGVTVDLEQMVVGAPHRGAK